jgi:filamentous hemagglutinin family protein
MKFAASLHWCLGGLSLGWLLAESAIAQVTPDRTLGTRVERSGRTQSITGGRTSGRNLFHSFEQFSVLMGETAHFQNSAAIRNIFSRVTGRSPSEINGILRANGTANLFLLNPNGILFGPNAQLDIGGSLFASTASSIGFVDGTQFSANPSQTPVLTVSVPVGLGLGSKPIAPLANAGNLRVNPGQQLTLLGSTVTSTGTLAAPGGRVQLLGDYVGLLDNARIDVSSSIGGGTVQIGGDFQGNGQLPRALRTYIAPTATIAANATAQGNGGRVIIWSEQGTQVYGTIQARGGATGGNGGFVETSSRGGLEVTTTPDITAPVGQAGTWLIDPRNITIGPANRPTLGFGQPFTAIANDAYLSVNTLLAALNGGATVVISTGTTGSQDGNITLATNLNYNGRGTNTLTLRAANDINLNGQIFDSAPAQNSLLGVDRLNLNLLADEDNSGAGSVFINQPIVTQGGNLRAIGRSRTVQGIGLNAAINTGGGAITLTGETAGSTPISSWGIVSDFVPIVSGGGAITLTGAHTGGGENVGGIALQGALNSGGGAISVNGSSTTGFGVLHVNQGSLASNRATGVGGAVTIQGSGARGVLLAQPVTTGGGRVTIVGTGTTGTGVEIGSLFTSGGGAVAITGTGRNGAGVYLSSPLQSAGGNITLSGTSTGDFATQGIGIDAAIDSGGGALNFTGSTTGSTAVSSWGIASYFVPINSGGGAINFTGTHTGGGSNVGGIALQGNLNSGGGNIQLNGTSTTSGFGLIHVNDGSLTSGNGTIVVQGQSNSNYGILSDRPVNAGQGEISFTGTSNTSIGTFLVSADNTTGITSTGGDIILTGSSGQADDGLVLLTPLTSSGGALRFRGTSNGGTGIYAASLLDSGGGLIEFVATGDLEIPSSQSSTQLPPVLGGGTTNPRQAALTSSGDVILRATGAIDLNEVNFQTSTTTAARGGNITIASATDEVAIRDSTLNASTSGAGAAGNISVTATGRNGAVTIVDSTISSNVAVGATNQTQAGDIRIETNQFSLSNSELTTDSNSSVTVPGDIRVNARRGIAAEASTISSTGVLAEPGEFSTIELQAPEGSVTLNGVDVLAENQGNGFAGNIYIDGRDTLQIRNSTLSADGSLGYLFLGLTEATESNPARLATLTIENSTLSATNRLSPALSAGEVRLRSTDRISILAGSTVENTTTGSGDAGLFTITTNRLQISDRSSASVSSTGTGNPGNLIVNAREIELRDRAKLNATNTGGGIGGNGFGDVSLNGVTRLLVTDNSELTTAATGSSTAGSIRLNAGEPAATDVTISERSRLAATAERGNAGNLSLNAAQVTIANNAAITTSNAGSNAGGDIAFRNLNRLNLSNGSEVSTTTVTGSAGDVQINQGQAAADRVRVAANSKITAQATGSGSSGNLQLNARQVLLEDRSQLSIANLSSRQPGTIQFQNLRDLSVDNSLITASTQTGNAGSITVDASARVTLRGRVSSSDRGGLLAEATAGGNAGNLVINTPELSVTNGAQATVSSTRTGTAGNLTVTAPVIRLDNDALLSATNEAAISADSNIRLRNVKVLTVSNGSEITTSTRTGRAGNVTLNEGQTAADGVRLSRTGKITAQATGDGGQSGNVTLNAAQVTLTEDAIVSATNVSSAQGSNITFQGLRRLEADDSRVTTETARGTAGTITVAASDAVTLRNGAGLVARATAGGDAGNLSIATPQLTVSAGSQATVSSTGTGTAGNLTVTAPVIRLDNDAVLSATNEAATSDDSNIRLREVETLTVSNGSEITTSTRTGRAGNITVNLNDAPAETVQLSNDSEITAQATSRGGRSGNVSLRAEQVRLTENSSISATNISSQVGGSIGFQGLERLEVDDSRITTSTERGAAGNIRVAADRSVHLTNGGELASKATNGGDGGTVTIVTPSLSVTNQATATVSSTGRGRSGSLSVEAQSVNLSNGGGLNAATEAGRGGDIRLRQVDRLQITTGAQISNSTVSGQGGAIEVQTNSVQLNDGKITSLSKGSGQAGSVTLAIGGDLTATNRSEISASSERGGGGSIAIQARTILLTGSSPILSQVSTGSGGGGSIDITASERFYAFLDSDILANAQDGRGGRIQIDAPVFLADLFAPVRRNPGSLDRFRNNGRVDINASSAAGVSGTVTVPDFSFLQNALSELATDLVSSDTVVAGSCLTRRNQNQGSFVVTGTGGLPASPYDLIEHRYQLAPVQAIAGATAQTALPVVMPAWKRGDPIQEAQGLVKTADGRVLISMVNPAAVAPAATLLCSPDRP